MSSEFYVHLFSYIYTRYTHVSTHTHSRAHVEFAKRVSQRQIYPAGRSRHWLRIGGRSQRKLQAMNGVIKSVLHTATQPHVGNILPCFALRSASAMFRARRRGIVHNVFEVSPAHIGHWRKKKSEHVVEQGTERDGLHDHLLLCPRSIFDARVQRKSGEEAAGHKVAGYAAVAH